MECELRGLTKRTTKGYYNNTKLFLTYWEKQARLTELEEIKPLHILLNSRFFDDKLPPLTITIQSVKGTYGHFSLRPDTWVSPEGNTHELNIAAGHLNRPIEQVTATLAHEMTHFFCHINGIRDTSRGNSYHGYARVSTIGQGRDGNSLEEQVQALQNYGCQEIVTEAFTGKTVDRPKFQKLMKQLKEGDTLVVCKLDRFARTAIEGVQTVRELFERGIRVHILNMGLIENTLTGNLILTVMLAFAEYERGMIVERTQTGKTIARQDPNYREGRPKKYHKTQITHALELLEEGKTYRQVEALTGISKSTLVRARRDRA